MKIFLTGGTGFVGTHLTAFLIQGGHQVTILARSVKERKLVSPGISYLQGDCTKRGHWQDSIRDHDVVINLAGASIFSRWTEAYKNLIIESRVDTTRNVVEGISSATGGRITLFSASGTGYYGFHEDEELTEDSPPGNDFLARVAHEWETEAFKAEEYGARVVTTRFGIVLERNGGALGEMIPFFRMFIGGPIGNGLQWFSWTHMKDLLGAFDFLMRHSEISGPVNFCSPEPVRNKDLAKALGKILNRPSLIPAPGFMIRLALGEFGSVILNGQRAVPGKLLDADFIFQYPEIAEALREIVVHYCHGK